MLISKRKDHLVEFSLRQKLVPTILLALLFATGLVILFQYGLLFIAAYLLLWIVSYPVIYAGTCRYCANYGRPCPVALEGGMVHRFFDRVNKPFGTIQLIWASFAYLLRIAIPAFIIIQNQLWSWGILYGAIFTGYWFVHLRITGCTNCVNYQCLLNPGTK